MNAINFNFITNNVKGLQLSKKSYLNTSGINYPQTIFYFYKKLIQLLMMN